MVYFVYQSRFFDVCRLTVKSELEVITIKETLSSMFENMSKASSRNESARSDLQIKAGYTVFLNVIAPVEDYSYDLLSWAVEEYTSRLSKAMVKGKPPAEVYKHLIGFVMTLSNHFRASPQLVRYGASLCLFAALKAYPQLVQENRQLFNFIISGALDSNYQCQFLYTSMLEVVKPDQQPKKEVAPVGVSTDFPFTHFNQAVRSMIASLRHSDKIVTYDSLYKTIQNTASIQLCDILEEAAKGCPPIYPKLLHRAANSLDYFPRKEKLRQLELVRVWSGRSEKVL